MIVDVLFYIGSLSFYILGFRIITSLSKRSEAKQTHNIFHSSGDARHPGQPRCPQVNDATSPLDAETGDESSSESAM
jgi:hypothetical protein